MAIDSSGGNAAFTNWNNKFSHIADPGERRRLALAEVDRAPFGWYHVRAVLVAGTGFLCDAYDIFAINIASVVLAYAFFSTSALPSSSDSALKVATSAGTVFGQLFFGWLADAVGRKRIYGLELIIIISSTLAQAISGESASLSIIGVLIFWRIIMGIGIGGDYPLSSIITSEFASTRWRGAMMGAVFAMQGMGQFFASLVSLLAVIAFKSQLEPYTGLYACVDNCAVATDRIWRIIIGFGGIPACFALYFRLTIPESPRYQFDVSMDVEKAADDADAFLKNKAHGDTTDLQRAEGREVVTQNYKIPKASWADFYAHFSQWKHLKLLVATAGSWFFLDVAFYGLGLNNSVILQAIGYAGSPNVYENLYSISAGNIILVTAGAIPGYWTTVFTVDWIGRRPIQLGGFIILTLIFCVIGFAFHQLSAMSLFALYILAQFFFNFGPNATTFIVPGECFPTRYRSTAHGISAASGKMGAILAQCVIGPLKDIGGAPGSSNWLNHVMQIFAGFMFCGIFTTLLLPETKRKTLEELSYELHGEDTYERRIPIEDDLKKNDEAQ